MSKRFAFITTVSGGYMFALHTNFVTNRCFKINADFHVIYHDSIDVEYREACQVEFGNDFDIVWHPMTGYESDFHNSKYKYAKELAGKYDAVCLIDADLFIASDFTCYFESVVGKRHLITAQHLWSGGILDNLMSLNWEEVKDRAHAQAADFPLFIDPVECQDFLRDWYAFTKYAPDKEECHPLVACNRAIRKNFKADQVILIDGHKFIADMDFWMVKYFWNRNTNELFDQSGQRIHSVHNKWWKDGRANGEFRAHTWVDKNHEYYGRLLTGEHNFNEIKDMMAFFNDQSAITRRDDYLKEKIIMTDILTHLK